MLRPGATLVTLAVLGALAWASGVRAQCDPAAGWRGVKVLPKLNAVVKVENKVIQDNKTKVNQKLSLPWVVQDVKDGWLWVGGSRKGWVQRSDVVTLDEAPQYYTALINRGEQKAWAYNMRAIAWEEKGDLDLAVADFGEKLRLEPDAITYNNRGTVWEAKEDYDKAIADYNQAIRLDSTYAIAYNNRGLAWSGKKNYVRAIADYDQAIRLDPNYAQAHKNRGSSWRAKKKYDYAIRDYGQAIRLNPNNAPALNASAWLRATCPDEGYCDGQKAVANATTACNLSGWSNGYMITTLAAAYAKAGDFDKAVDWQERAIELLPSNAAVKAQLERYKQHKPYRDE
jgi:tetratricopeptide (TPR) repeat protein